MPDSQHLELEKVRRALESEETERPVIKYRVKISWWTWVLGIMFNIIAVRCFFLKIYFLFYLTLFFDIVVIFPEVSHLYYTIENNSLVVRRILYRNLVIPCSTITMVENATLLTFGGFSLKIWEYSLGAYKITYMANGRRFTVNITPKKRKEFMDELELYLGKGVVLLEPIENKFKQQKK